MMPYFSDEVRETNEEEKDQPRSAVQKTPESDPSVSNADSEPTILSSIEIRESPSPVDTPINKSPESSGKSPAADHHPLRNSSTVFLSVDKEVGNEGSTLPLEVSTAATDEDGREIAGASEDAGSRNRSLSASLTSSNTPFPHPPQHQTFWQTLVLAYGTLGVVYGDLGTSPLYVYPSINVKDPTEADYLGVLSLIFWTLTLIGVVKYTLIVLQADDHGEGGTFAVYSLLCQYAKISQDSGADSPVQDMGGRRISHSISHHSESKEAFVYNPTKYFLENNVTAQKVLHFVVMMGTCMLVGDGILTPAISVLSAIEGIATATPSLNKAVVVVVSAVILILLFLGQRFGTHRVSRVFSPIMALWLVTTPSVGVYNITVHYPGIFKAFSPAHIYYFFKANKKDAWMMLGGTVLCITGAEAMFADMGHFNKRSIQLAFTTMVYPSVLLTYAGQTAYLIKHPGDHHQGFFKMIPSKVFWPMFVISTLAAIVASQGLISATFSVIKQSTALHYFPRVKLVHTSEDVEGQIYSPEVNYILMILCLAVVFGFRSSSTIGNAFGVAVVTVMLITTCLISLVMLVIWRTPVLLTLLFFLIFVLVEGTYMSAVVTKVPQGGWLPFVVSVIVTIIMFSWNMGRLAKFKYEMRNKITKENLGDLLVQVGDVRVSGLCFFYTDLLQGVPPILVHYVKNVRSLHRVLVFTTIRWLPVKTVLPAERFLVGRVGFNGVYRCVARYGYRDVLKMQNNEFVDQFVSTLTQYILSTQQTNQSASSLERDTLSADAIASEVSVLEKARADGPVFVLGKGELRVSRATKIATRIFVGKIYRFLETNCRSEVSTLNIPYAQILEVGMLYDI